MSDDKMNEWTRKQIREEAARLAMERFSQPPEMPEDLKALFTEESLRRVEGVKKLYEERWKEEERQCNAIQTDTQEKHSDGQRTT